MMYYELIQDGDCFDGPMTKEELITAVEATQAALQSDADRFGTMIDEIRKRADDDPRPIQYEGNYLKLEVDPIPD